MRDTIHSTGPLLHDAAGEPKELWYEPELGRTAFDTELPQQFEARVVGFFDRYLLGEQGDQANADRRSRHGYLGPVVIRLAAESVRSNLGASHVAGSPRPCVEI